MCDMTFQMCDMTLHMCDMNCEGIALDKLGNLVADDMQHVYMSRAFV